MTIRFTTWRSRPKNSAWVVFNPQGKAVGISLDTAVHAWNDLYENYDGPLGNPVFYVDTAIKRFKEAGYYVKRVKITP